MQCKLNASAHEPTRVNVQKALANLTPAHAVEVENSKPSERSPAREVAPPRAIVIKVTGLESADARNAVIKSLLGVKGVTSVTIDQRRAQAVVYTSKSDEIKPTLLEAIRSVELQHAEKVRVIGVTTDQ